MPKKVFLFFYKKKKEDVCLRPNERDASAMWTVHMKKKSFAAWLSVMDVMACIPWQCGNWYFTWRVWKWCKVIISRGKLDTHM